MKRSIFNYFDSKAKTSKTQESQTTSQKAQIGKDNNKAKKSKLEIIEISSDEGDHFQTPIVKKTIKDKNKPNTKKAKSPERNTPGKLLKPNLNEVLGRFDKPKPTTALSSDINHNEEASVDNEQVTPYYLNDFLLILDTILNNSDDLKLFEGEDETWMLKFKSLSIAAQKLYVRLYQRKYAWLPAGKISYPRIASNMGPVLSELSSKKFLMTSQRDGHFSLSQALTLLPAPHVKDIAKSHHIKGSNKENIVSSILLMCKQQRCVLGSATNLETLFLKKTVSKLGDCFKVAPDPKKVFNRALLVFDVTKGTSDNSEFTIAGQSQAAHYGRQQQLSSILLAGMGRVKFAEYAVDYHKPIFECRSSLLEYEIAYQIKLEVMAASEASQWMAALELCEKASDASKALSENSRDNALQLPTYLRVFTASAVYIQILSLKVEILQRLKRYKEAVDILRLLLDQKDFCVSRRGYWKERLALNLDQHLHDITTAWQLLQDSINDRYVRVGHKVALHERGIKLQQKEEVKALGCNNLFQPNEFKVAEEVTIVGRLLPKRMQTGKARFMWQNSDDGDDVILCSVEEYALKHYENLGYEKGIHREGGTFAYFFCLLMWDIIFMDGIPGVFRTKYQAHPLDLYSDEFYANRKAAIDRRLGAIARWKGDDFSVPDKMAETWRSQENVTCTGMNWDIFPSIQQAVDLATCLGGPLLSGIVAILCKDFRHTRSGLPDLVVWSSTSHKYKFVEVKGPNDRLQNNQKMWMHELVGLGANVEVCYVSAGASRKLR